ncbi:MAG: hypothetical protein OXN97_07050 [Bryobacterales bacterium]|nr:hypothetical protein [Bryobacterales bacterium]
MPKRPIQKVGKKDKFRFRQLDSIGVAAAEEDFDFLAQCFVDTGHLRVLSDCSDPRSIVVGRTGSGKTALLKRLSATEERVIDIRPESLALSYISNSTILNFFDNLGVKLDIFFKLLWRHVFTVELIKLHFHILDGSPKNTFIQQIRSLFLDDKEKKALQYLENWGSKFWQETEYRIKEVTEKLEEDLKTSVRALFPSIQFDVGATDKHIATAKGQIIKRAQRVVNAVQIRQLSDIIDLTDKVLSDRQKHYFIVLDNLDENWIEDRLRYRLIRALIETVKDFRRIRNAKIVIALRIDLIEKVFQVTRDTGFQEEKYESLYLPISWTENTLEQMLNLRINHLIRRRYTKQSVTHRDLLPTQIDGQPSLRYLLRRTMMRPRDVIMFFNCCIAKAVNRPRISVQIIRDAEGLYSKNRLRSLADEWVSDYPHLLYFTRLIKSRKATFLADDIKREIIEEVCIGFCIDHPSTENGDPFSKAATRLVDALVDIEYVRNTILQGYYRAGLIGLKLESFETAQWSTLDSRTVSKSQISHGVKVLVHPMLWRALGIDSR